MTLLSGYFTLKHNLKIYMQFTLFFLYIQQVNCFKQKNDQTFSMENHVTKCLLFKAGSL